MANAAVRAWEALQAMSEPIPLDLSRGHELFLCGWKAVGGGVVAWRYQAFCACYWSQRWPTGERAVAVRTHAAHVAAVGGDG